jgi:hypothetical protein
LVFLLAFTTYTTLEKGLQQWNKETKQFADEKKSILSRTKEVDEEREESRPLLASRDHPDSSKEIALINIKKHADGDIEGEQLPAPQAPMMNIDNHDNIGKISSFSRVGESNPDLAKLLEEERNTPMDKVIMITIMIGMVIILNLLKGGGHEFPSPLGIICGSLGYWVVTLIVFLWILGFSIYMRSILITKWNLKKKVQYRYLEGDVEWNPVNTILFPGICFFAGFFAGLFGVGGGIVKGPLMLYMGVHPLVASATSAVMIMFTSLAGTTMHIAFDTLTWDYGIFMFILGLLATVVGQFGVSYLVTKYRRVSLVSLSIGLVVALSTLLMAVQSVFTLLDTNVIPKSALCE